MRFNCTVNFGQTTLEVFFSLQIWLQLSLLRILALCLLVVGKHLVISCSISAVGAIGRENENGQCPYDVITNKKQMPTGFAALCIYCSQSCLLYSWVLGLWIIINGVVRDLGIMLVMFSLSD